MRPTVWVLFFGLGLLSLSAPARAGEVMCEDENGKCTVGNDPDSVSCACGDEAGGGGTGGDEWEGLTDEELMKICLAELEFCGFGESDTGEGTSTTGVDPDGDDGMDDGVDGTGTTVTSTSTSTGDGDGDGDGDATDGGDAEGTSTGDGTGEDGTGEDGTGDGGTGTEGGMEGTDDAADAGAETDGTGTDTDTGADGGAGDDGSKAGCGCRVDGGRDAWAGAVLGLGLLGLRRRRP